MAEAEIAGGDDASAVEPPKSTRRRLPRRALIAVLAALPLLGGGGYFGWREYLAPKSIGAAAPLEPPVYADVPAMVVNMDTAAGGSHFIKVRVVLAMEDKAGADAVKLRIAEIIDPFLSFLREIRPEDLAGSQGTFRIKEELLIRASLVVAPHKVRDVLLQEIVQQ